MIALAEPGLPLRRKARMPLDAATPHHPAFRLTRPMPARVSDQPPGQQEPPSSPGRGSAGPAARQLRAARRQHLRQEPPMFIGVGTIIVIVLLVLAIMLLCRR
jgi:hypothetical protein